jgi:hypothetical protein
LRLALNDFRQADRGQPSQRLQKHRSHYGRRQAALPVQCGPPRPYRRAALEDAEDYKAFEAAIIADYDVQSAVERELVLRLASLLWRLRRATTMETGLFEIRAAYLREFRQSRQVNPASREVVYALFGRADPVSFDGGPVSPGITNKTEAVASSGSISVEPAVDPTADLARCFLRLANLPNFALDRLSRYKATLWRQAGGFCLLSMLWVAQATGAWAPFP